MLISHFTWKKSINYFRLFNISDNIVPEEFLPNLRVGFGLRKVLYIPDCSLTLRTSVYNWEKIVSR